MIYVNKCKRGFTSVCMHMCLFSFYIKVSVVWNGVRAVHYFIVQQCYILHIKCFRWAKSRHLCLWVDHKRQNSDTASQSKWFVIYGAVRDEWIDIYGGFQLRSTDGRKCFGNSGEKLHQNFKINILMGIPLPYHAHSQTHTRGNLELCRYRI